MKNADKIKREIEQMNVHSTAAMRQRILADAAQAMEQSMNVGAGKPGLNRSAAMRYVAAFSTAAAVLIVFFSFFPSASRIKQPTAKTDTSPCYILSNILNNQSNQKEMIPCNILPVIPD